MCIWTGRGQLHSKCMIFACIGTPLDNLSRMQTSFPSRSRRSQLQRSRNSPMRSAYRSPTRRWRTKLGRMSSATRATGVSILSLHFCSLYFHIFTVIAVLVCHPIPPPTFNVFCLPVTRGTVVGDFLIFFIFGLTR